MAFAAAPLTFAALHNVAAVQGGPERVPGHSTGALRPSPSVLGPAVFVLDLLQAAAAVQTTTFLKTEAKGPLVLKV